MCKKCGGDIADHELKDVKVGIALKPPPEKKVIVQLHDAERPDDGEVDVLTEKYWFEMYRNGYKLYDLSLKRTLTWDELPAATIVDLRAHPRRPSALACQVAYGPTKFAVDGVKGYHDALESQTCEALQAEIKDGKTVVANHGLYHETSNTQVWMSIPPVDRLAKQHEKFCKLGGKSEHFSPIRRSASQSDGKRPPLRERDGLLLTPTTVTLVSVKSRMTPQCIRQHLWDIGALLLNGKIRKAPQSIDAVATVLRIPSDPQTDPESKTEKTISLRDYLHRTFPAADIPSKVTLRGLCVSPLFHPDCDLLPPLPPYVELRTSHPLLSPPRSTGF